MSIKKINLLFNPYNGKKQAKNTLTELTELLDTNSIPYDLIKNEKKDDLINLARIAANEIKDDPEQFMVVVGEDNTLSNVINGIKLSRYPLTPVAYLATGKVNNFQNATGTPQTPQALFQLLTNNPKPVRIDLGHYEELNHHQEKYFVNNMTIGFEATIKQLSTQSFFSRMVAKINLNGLALFWSFIRALSTQQTFRVNIEDEYRRDQYLNALMVVATNHEYFGEGIKFTPQISNTNHQIGLVVIERPPLWKFLGLIYKMLKNGMHVNSPYFHLYKAKSIKVETNSMQPAELDSDDLGNHTFDLKFDLDCFNLLK